MGRLGDAALRAAERLKEEQQSGASPPSDRVVVRRVARLLIVVITTIVIFATAIYIFDVGVGHIGRRWFVSFAVPW